MTPESPTPTPGPGRGEYLTCREMLDFVMAYLDGELPAEQRREFDRHLGVCPSCVNYLKSYEATVRMGKVSMGNPDAPASGTVPEWMVRAVREARVKGTSA